MRVTFSALPRLEVCPTSAALPQVRNVGEYADRGSARHLYLEHVASLGREKALALVPEEHRGECARIEIEGLPVGPGARSEVAYALRRGRPAVEIGRGLRRKYPVEPGDLPGTADVVEQVAGEPAEGIVADYKGEHDDTPPRPADNLQLLAGAVAAASVNGWNHVHVALYHLREDGSWWLESADVDSLDLAAAEERIWRVYDRVAAATLSSPVTRSEHCRWCPAFSACPATLALAKRLGSEPAGVAEEARALLSRDTASHALQLTRLARKVLDQVEDEIRDFARAEGPIPMPGGKVYGPRPTERLKAGVALRVVRELYGEEVEAAARKVSASKASIAEALEPVAVARGVRPRAIADETFEAIRAANGFEVTEEWRDVRAQEAT